MILIFQNMAAYGGHPTLNSRLTGLSVTATGAAATIFPIGGLLLMRVGA